MICRGAWTGLLVRCCTGAQPHTHSTPGKLPHSTSQAASASLPPGLTLPCGHTGTPAHTAALLPPSAGPVVRPQLRASRASAARPAPGTAWPGAATRAAGCAGCAPGRCPGGRRQVPRRRVRGGHVQRAWLQHARHGGGGLPGGCCRCARAGGAAAAGSDALLSTKQLHLPTRKHASPPLAVRSVRSGPACMVNPMTRQTAMMQQCAGTRRRQVTVPTSAHPPHTFPACHRRGLPSGPRPAGQ